MTSNMLKVLFFAKLREQLQCDALQLNLHAPLSSKQQLLDLIAAYVKAESEDFAVSSDRFLQLLSADNIVMAVNHQVAKGGVSIASGDEVAFYPPVTGG